MFQICRTHLPIVRGVKVTPQLRSALRSTHVLPQHGRSYAARSGHKFGRRETVQRGYLGLPFVVGAGYFNSARAEPSKPPTKEMTLTEALTELNSAINSLLMKMQHSSPEMADAGLLWLLGYGFSMFNGHSFATRPGKVLSSL